MLGKNELNREGRSNAAPHGSVMQFEDWIRTQIEAGATVSVGLGLADDRSHASLMTWSDKTPGSHFWSVTGNTVKHLAFIGGKA